MELAPRYCRSCGSRILVKNVCHNCNNDPLKEDNYCYDCGALTPKGDVCLKCGANYKRNSPVKLGIFIAAFLIIAFAAAAYFLTGDQNISEPKNTTQPTVISENKKQEIPATQDTIVNKPVVEVNKPVIDTMAAKPKAVADTVVSKPLPVDTSKSISLQIFSADELKTHNIKCSYFIKNKSQVLFFIAGGSGFIKMNNAVIELKRKQKGADLEKFANNEYEATIIIKGLSGSAKEWLASCTLIIKDIIKNTSVKQKVYSGCIEL